MTAEGHEPSTHRGFQDLTIEDLRGVLFGDNADVRAQFLNHFGQMLDDFLSHAVRAYSRLQAFGRGVFTSKPLVSAKRTTSSQWRAQRSP